jgi:hypothetical protein
LADIRITQPDAVDLKIECDRSLARELNGYFTFTVPNFQYTPAFKKRLWDGKIRLFNLYTQTIYAGLIDLVIKFAKDRGYTWEHIPVPYDTPKPEEVKQFIQSLPLSAGSKPIQPYDYQVEAVQHALNRSRALLVSPTGSGKSMMIYLLCRWMLDKNPTGKLLIIVPTTSLVAQMLADFRDYSKQDSWKADRNIHTVMSGKDKTSTKTEMKNSLDVDFLKEQGLTNALDAQQKEMYQDKLSRNFLDQDFLANILDILDAQMKSQLNLLNTTKGGLLPDYVATSGITVEVDEPKVTLCRDTGSDIQCVSTPTRQSSTIYQTQGSLEFKNRVNSGGGTIITLIQK